MEIKVGIFLTFLTYFATAFFILLTFMGAGKLIYGLLIGNINAPITKTRIIHELVIGFCAVYIFSSLLFTYLSASWAMKSGVFFLIILLAIGLGNEIFRIKDITSRKTTLFFLALFTVSFILVYLPFYKAQKIFLASEGGGDITGYLGFANVYLNQLSYPTVETSRFLIMMRYRLEALGFVTINRLPVYAEMDPAVYGFNNDFASTTYLPTLFFFPFRFIFSPEAIYMSLWMIVVALTPFVVAISIQKNIKWASVWTICAFLGIIFSSGFQSIFLNHYIYQLISIFMVAAFFSSLIRLIAGDPISRPLIAICLFAMTVICMSYFPATPPIIVLAGWGGILILLANHWRNPGKSIFSYSTLKSSGWFLFAIILLLPLLLEPYLRIAGCMSLVSGTTNPADLAIRYAIYGPTVRAIREIWNGMQGTLIHNLGQPYTTLDFHSLWNYKVGFVTILLIVLCIIPLLRIIPNSWKSPQDFWQSRSPVVLLALGSLAIATGFLLICRTHTYTFDKMAMLMLPVTIISILTLLSESLSASTGRTKILVGTISVLFLTSWILGMAQARFYQVQSFWKNMDRTSILYTENYLKSLPYPGDPGVSPKDGPCLKPIVGQPPVLYRYIQNTLFNKIKFSFTADPDILSEKNPALINIQDSNCTMETRPSRSIMYTNAKSGTEYFLMEASLAGLNTLPANNYYHANYPKFLSKIDFRRSNYIITRDNGADAYDIKRFYLDDNKNDYAVPIGAAVDPIASSFPKKIVIGRPTPEGTGIVLEAASPWNVNCEPFDSQKTCYMEIAKMGSEKYTKMTGQLKKDGSCHFQIAGNKNLRVLRFQQCHVISFNSNKQNIRA